MNADDIRVLWDRINVLFPGSRRRTAVITASPVDTALAYLYQSFSKKLNRLEVFTTYAAAESWILDYEYPESGHVSI
jgi:hypothetical protein